MNKDLTLEQKLEIYKEVGEEITTLEELEKLFESGEQVTAYDGFEPSGKIHIAQGLLRATNINRILSTNTNFKMLIADWHGWANHKMGGDLGKIQKVGEYFVEVWKACGLNTNEIEFVWASDLVKQDGYWDTVMKIAVQKNLPRIIRTVEIMGRNESESLTASQILYPLMQATDIFTLGANVTQLGMDQRKVNMLAREVAEDLGYKKPIVVSHHMLLGLLPPENKEGDESSVDRSIRLKMSKSKPDSAIFMTDTYDDIKRKITKAWAPEGEIKENPVLEYCKYIIFAKEEKMVINRLEKFGGDIEYASYDELEKAYESKELFPLDLKNSVIEYINGYIEPVRNYFNEDSNARKLKEEVDSFEITR